VDEAMPRRFHLIPFTVTIPPDERDPDLTEKLKTEWPGILQWMIDGCLDWQKVGLQPPEIVRLATDAYLDAEDALAAWIEEVTTTDPKRVGNHHQPVRLVDSLVHQGRRVHRQPASLRAEP
jgi:putative DNA primase/helicase